jgi:hypothetical protein
MAMSRFVLRFRGKGPAPADDIERIRALPKTKVLDNTSPRMLLVEAPEEDLRALVDSLPEWVMTPEKMISLPDPRPKLHQTEK